MPGGLLQLMSYGNQDVDVDFDANVDVDFDRHKIKSIEHKLICTENDNTCPITYNDIEYGDDYTTCNKCNKNFNFDALNKWRRTMNNCPMCREFWTNNVHYKNSKPISK